MDAGAFLLPCLRQALGESLADDKVEYGTDQQQDQGITVQPITEPPQAAGLLVLAKGHRTDFPAQPAPIEITRRGMMHGMFPAPSVVRRKGQETEQRTDQVIRPACTEKGTMSAVVLQNEQANEKTGRQRRQAQAERVVVLPKPQHAPPAQRKSPQRGRELPHGPPPTGSSVRRQDAQHASIGFDLTERRTRNLGLTGGTQALTPAGNRRGEGKSRIQHK